jgi:S-adenosylmethionine decarboxylase
MTKQSPPFIFKSDEHKYPDKAGLSGWVPLIESGIQIHTLTPKNFISIDVYSCKKFSTEHISDFAQDYFGCKEVEMNYIDRGVKYSNIV